MTNDLIPVKEAAKQLGYKHEGTLFQREKRGDFQMVRQGGRTFIHAADMEKVRATMRSVKDKTPEPSNGEVPGDPVDQALGVIMVGLKDLRKALKQHDETVRRQAIADLADSLKEAATR